MTRRTVDPSIADTLPGLHRVRMKTARGVAEYWYAWRGGPRIARIEAASDAALPRALAQALPAAIDAYKAEREPAAGARQADSRFVYGLITRYLEALSEPAFAHLSDRTKADRRKHLEMAREDLGEMETRSLEAKGARAFLIQWRDRFKATPKTADDRLGALSAVLQWAHDRGELSANPVAEFPRLYRANRAEIIWEPQHLALLLAHADSDAFRQAVQLAALTGLREADLVKLPWTAVGPDAIVWQTGKSRGRRTIVVPLTAPLRKLLAGVPRKDATTVLTSTRGRPWKVSGLMAALRRARLAALAQALTDAGVALPLIGATNRVDWDAVQATADQAPGGPIQSGIEHLRWHDLRGTAATNFVAAGLELLDVAQILGWKPDKVREIAARYVSGQAIGLAIVRKLNRNARRPPAVKGPVKDA